MGDKSPQSGRLIELRRREAALRGELLQVELEIEKEEALLRAAQAAPPQPEVALHHRPSWSLLGGLDEAGPETPERESITHVSSEDYQQLLKNFPPLIIDPIGSFNHWDRRECKVQNADAWRACCEKYMKEELKGNGLIPKVIHQIWIGPKEPPCLWIDTFRVEYCAAHPAWGFVLWSDEEVKKLPMLNEKLYHEEKMWQCKADILRLEFLWHYGGLYVDADMISVENKGLDVILELGKETGFVIAYEPDTKDKPYSILGNSVIAATPRHPLVLMLILYLKQTYPHKRHHIDVFAVTGPVMYTKCLIDSNMPLAIAAQELLYPAFHYVPNPDAINFSRFPKCLMFQFGYTCSGLEGYVKSKNRCKKARQCPFHSKKAWPLGPFRELPSNEAPVVGAGEAIPKVIHQLVLLGQDSSGDPTKWRSSWWDGFRRNNPDFQYKIWSKAELSGRQWFCANLYVEPFDDHAATALMLEILYDEGGYYVPLSTLYDATAPGPDPFFTATDFVEGNGGVLGAVKGSTTCYKKLMALYEQGAVGPLPPPSAAVGPRVIQMGFRDGLAARATFRPESRYLGAGQVVAWSPGLGDQRLELQTLGWAYESQVPCLAAKGSQAMVSAVAGPEGMVTTKAIFVADREFFQMDRLKSELPGILDSLGSGGWDLLLLGVEWNTGSDEVVQFKLIPGGRPRNCKVGGFVANFPSCSRKEALREVLKKCVTADGFDPSSLFDAAGQFSLFFAAEKYAGSIEEARIFRCIPTVDRVFNQIAGHTPPLWYDRTELHGNLMKAFQHGDHLRFEMILEPNGGIMFRSWNDDNSTNCEMKMTDTMVEWMKVYFNHQVIREERNKMIPS